MLLAPSPQTMSKCPGDIMISTGKKLPTATGQEPEPSTQMGVHNIIRLQLARLEGFCLVTPGVYVMQRK